MRDSAFLSVESSPCLERVFEAVANSESDNFLHLARLAGLDPATAFRYGNLKNVDFSDCDLRGLDFTGACLVGATGNEATIFDKTTILQDADIEGSLFSPKRTLDEIFSHDLHILNGDWADQVIWLEALRSDGRPTQDDMYQSLGAFYASENQFVKRIALETLSKLLDPSHIITLIEEEVIDTANRALIGPSLKVLKVLAVNHRPIVIKSAVKMLSGELAAEGAAFLVEIGIDKKNLRYLTELISRNTSSVVRRRFVAALADQEGAVTAALAREPLTRDIYDFGTNFDHHEIAALANFATVRRRIFGQRMASRSLSHYPELDADAALRDAFIGMDGEQTENEIKRRMLEFSTRYSLGWSFANHGSDPTREA